MPAALAPLADLGWLAILYIALGLAIIIAAIVEAVFAIVIPAVSKVPFLGDALHSIATKIASAITSVLYKAIHEIEVAQGAAWHWLADSVLWLWREFKSHAQLLEDIAGLLAGSLAAAYGLRKLFDELNKFAHGIDRLVRSFTKKLHAIDKTITRLEHEIAKGVGNDARSKLDALLKEWGAFKTGELRTLEADVARIPEDAIATEKWVAKNFPLIGSAVLTGAVAWALSQLGLGGLRCNSLLNSLKNRGCGLWNGLEDLLGLFIDVTLFASVCKVLDFLSPFVSEVAAPVVTELTVAGAGLCEGGIGAPPALPAVTLNLPANPGVTLNLP